MVGERVACNITGWKCIVATKDLSSQANARDRAELTLTLLTELTATVFTELMFVIVDRLDKVHKVDKVKEVNSVDTIDRVDTVDMVDRLSVNRFKARASQGYG